MKSNVIFIQNLLSGPTEQKVPLKSHENSRQVFVPGRNLLLLITFYKTLTRSEEKFLDFKNVDYVCEEIFGVKNVN